MIAGRYSPEREIGRGGMGAVVLCRDEVLGRRVALKRVGQLTHTDSPDLARAEREARLAARLNHPHVVAVFDLVADTDTDAQWLVMEYVEGTTLAQLVRERGRLTPDEAAPLLREVADALAAAHAAGIVHRDVKPSNILVDRFGRAKLTDFGIARIAADPALTQTGLLTGSPAYLAPEVAAGQRGDASADVWSFGATAFHVLAGRPPYDIDGNVLGALYRIVNEEPPRLAGAGWMTPLLEATMAKEPARRWSMAQVRDFLAAAPADGPPTAMLPAPVMTGADDAATRTLRTSRKASDPRARLRRPRKGVLAGLVALALVAVLGLLLLTVLPDHGPAADTAARTPSGSTSGRSTASGRSTGAGPDATAAPTAQGMESFIRGYVAAVSSDPDTAWTMLTPKFQRQSGGLDTYRRFWDGVGAGHVLEVSADPRNLVVSYRVRFDHFGTGRRPTVLELAYDHGRYRIDGERTRGFHPAG